ncbi:hypothetical protein UlMin_006100 [Ulmus minor]
MVSTRARNRPKSSVEKSTPQTFETLIAKGLKLPLLKNLHCVLVQLSLNESIGGSDKEHSLSYSDGEFEVKIGDLGVLAEILFKELDCRFKLLFSVLRDICANQAEGDVVLHSDMWDTSDELKVLLKCCLLILSLADQCIQLEKIRVLIRILREFTSLVTSGGNEKCVDSADADCTTLVSEEFVADSSILKPFDSCGPFLLAVLEAFADELSIQRLLRESFDNGYSYSVLDVISAHFIISLSGKEAFENFLNRLSCRFENNYRVPELGMPAVSFLLSPIIHSAPKMFQAHMILLAAEAIGIGMYYKNIMPDFRIMASYLTIFEQSVTLYTRHMSWLMDGHLVGGKGSRANPCSSKRGFQPSFECHIQEVTRAGINDVIAKSDCLWNMCLRNVFSRPKSDLLAESIAYINDNQHIFVESCKNDCISIVSSIIHGAFPEHVTDTLMPKVGHKDPQDLYVLAAILKLMSTSLLAVFSCLRHGANLGCLEDLEDTSSCKEYDFIVNVILCFRNFSVCLPNQKKLLDIMKTHLIRHKATKWMLLHFSGLLSLSFASGFDFLVNSTVFAIMTLMNLYIFEEGNVVALRSFLDSGSESLSSKVPGDKVEEGPVHQKLTERIVSEFRKIQTVYSSGESLLCVDQRSEVKTAEKGLILKEYIDGEKEKSEECNKKAFLKCVLGSTKTSDYDDLANFIECEPGKDYSRWLKKRERYRRWRNQKIAVLRLKKKISAFQRLKKG